jgi:hypothetical protein
MAENKIRNKGEVICRSPKEHEDRMIKDILENFDFQKCRIAMISLGWKWGLEGISPTIEMLKNSAENRLRNAIENAKKDKCPKATYFSSSGGLKGNAWCNKYGHVEGIRLEFVLTDWDSDGDY